LKKKRSNNSIDNYGTVLRTVDDYETLRHFIVEGGETPDGVEYDLARLIARGVAVWLYQKREPQSIEYVKQFKPQKKLPAGNLAVLLANMMES